ncbi:dimethylarginine dimethylaminohydrolase family protein [Amphibacillus indicireducens]|uniref:Dimethylarginine dimethylaminohydrolase family protein n=1 Tax=Amphibacillus indicireducens TaxID=1076330 RepID=A0ABP7VNN4_9BACI
MKLAHKIVCHNEYDRLKQVIVTPPTHMRIEEVINETQKHYQDSNIDIDKALEQHRYFQKVMRDHGVEVIEIEPRSELNEQVFTRDIGVTIGTQVIVSQMATDLRERETVYLKKFLVENNMAHMEIMIDSIEGGDVILDEERIWIGVSDRTTEIAIQSLQQFLPNYQIETIDLKNEILHLDCTFNLVGPNLALIYREGILEADYQRLNEHYQLIEVDSEEQFTLGTNVLSIAPGKVISLPENKRTNQKLREAGLEVIEVPFNEIIKSGGSFRCCTMPIYREK